MAIRQSSISYSWRERDAAQGFISGVSLHSHTCNSKETLDFLATMGTEFKVLRPIFDNRERRCRELHGFELNYKQSYWTPPLPPHLAFKLEKSQIEDRLQLPALVSITDHDDIQAPLSLRADPRSCDTPISVEWTVPYRDSVFHLGIHNLPVTSAAVWMQTLAEVTATTSAARLPEILHALHSFPDTLIVFNHPVWDLNKVGSARHLFCIDEFMRTNNPFIHAMELNGLRGWQENRQVELLAQKWNQLLISGGDRHGAQPNANTNLTHASTFEEFVHEVRIERISHILFMPQYAIPWRYRVFESTLDVIRYYPDFPEGSRNWDDRVYHPDHNGVIRPVSQLWPQVGREPLFVRFVLSAARLLGVKPLSSGLRLAWNDPHEMRMPLSGQVES